MNTVEQLFKQHFEESARKDDKDEYAWLERTAKNLAEEKDDEVS